MFFISIKLIKIWFIKLVTVMIIHFWHGYTKYLLTLIIILLFANVVDGNYILFLLPFYTTRRGPRRGPHCHIGHHMSQVDNNCTAVPGLDPWDCRSEALTTELSGRHFHIFPSLDRFFPIL